MTVLDMRHQVRTEPILRLINTDGGRIKTLSFFLECLYG